MLLREFLKYINYEKGIINLNGVEYFLNDINFLIVNLENLLELLEEEVEFLDKL